MFAAAHDLGIEWIVIKGISDYAGGSKSKESSWRPFASLMAASVTAHILSDAIIFQDWPHFECTSKYTEQLESVHYLPMAVSCFALCDRCFLGPTSETFILLFLSTVSPNFCSCKLSMKN